MAIAKTREDWERVWLFFVCLKKLRYSNARPTKFESLYHEQKYLEEENGKMVALQISSKIESLYGLPGVEGHKIIRVCMEFCNFWKAPIWTIFR